MKKLVTAIVFIVILLVTLYFISLFTQKIYVDETLLEIKPHSSAKSIANTLKKYGIIKNPKIFYYYVRLTEHDKKLKSGEYLFKGEMNLLEVIHVIEKGKVHLRRITFPEGFTYKKICRKLSKNGFGDYKTFMSLCEDSLFVKQLTTFSKPVIEGFLYPDTYFFPKGASEEFIIKKMVKTFYDKTKDIDFRPDFPINFYETLTLASIVEKEAKVASEKPLIAGVYLKRLKDRYKLQADPTVAYVLEKKGRTRKKIYYKDLEIDSPYNTYKCMGLPPTPISNPSEETIEAVLNYHDTDYLFFFANAGKHIFSKNYKTHILKQNQIKYTRKR